MIGVGPALRKARILRGVTIDEASRDTKIRAEFLEALEEERFDTLLGDVYVRGCLRSYSTYLGLDPDESVSAYAESLLEPPSPSLALPASLDPVIAASRRRDNHRLAVLVAATAIAVAAAFGVLSSRSSSPPPAKLPTVPPSVEAAGQHVMAALVASKEVQVTVTADGVTRTLTLRPGEGRSFEATTSLTIALSRGGVVSLTVNGVDEGTPGWPRRPWKKTYSFTYSFEEPGSAPSPTG